MKTIELSDDDILELKLLLDRLEAEGGNHAPWRTSITSEEMRAAQRQSAILRRAIKGAK